MIIQNIEIITHNNKSKIQCDIDNKKIYLEFSSEYQNNIYLNYDGFLILALPIAMKQQKDLIIKGNISYKLYHNIKHYLMKLINIIIPECKFINIIPDEFTYGEKFNNTGVGCGLSCGVDSLCCLEDYYFNDCGPYKLTHVTNFYAGASQNEKQFRKRIQNIIEYTKNTSLKILIVKTNFTSINNYGHQKIHILRNLAIPLFFQKLFNKYYYASGQEYPRNNLFYSGWDIKNLEVQHILYDPIIIPLLSTENIEFILHGAQYKRYEKINRIINNKLCHKYLDICVDGKFVEVSKSQLNCSKCWKCMGTLYVIEHYNKLDMFKNRFDLNKYYKDKQIFLKNLDNKNPYDNEILELYKKTSNLLNKNEWYAVKIHWNINNGYIISNCNTWIKKSELHSSKLNNDQKKYIKKNSKLKLSAKQFNKLYYVVELL